MTSSLRACLAAESWLRLGKNEGGRGKKTSQEFGSFKIFAKDKFKVNALYAEQAQAILNHSPELLEDQIEVSAALTPPTK